MPHNKSDVETLAEICLKTDITLPEIEHAMVLGALRKTGGNQTAAAKLLNMTRDQVRYRMRRFEIDGDQF